MTPFNTAAIRYSSRPISTSRMIAPTASLVCSVASSRWSGRLACAAIRAVSTPPPHRALIDAGELIFDRVLDGQNLALAAVQQLQRGIEGRGLAAARRTGD